MHAVKLLQFGKMYFIPREYMRKLDVFGDLITQLEANNQHKNPKRMAMDSNSMFVVDDAQQHEKMAAAFYRSVRREIAEYQECANHLIQTSSQSVAIMDRWVEKIDGLEQKKREYETILRRELNDIDDDFSTLNYLSSFRFYAVRSAIRLPSYQIEEYRLTFECNRIPGVVIAFRKGKSTVSDFYVFFSACVKLGIIKTISDKLSRLRAKVRGNGIY